jgi:hypothetical protein
MQRHVLIHMISTYFNIADVEEIVRATSKQTQKNNANNKHNAPQTQTCGRIEITTHRKERKITLF